MTVAYSWNARAWTQPSTKPVGHLSRTILELKAELARLDRSFDAAEEADNEEEMVRVAFRQMEAEEALDFAERALGGGRKFIPSRAA